MPKLHEIVEYRFVEPFVGADGSATWRHPDGWKFSVIDSPVSIEAYADLIERHLVRARDQVKLCDEARAWSPDGHTANPGGCGGYTSVGKREPLCEARLRNAREVTRTSERTMLVRIEIPIL